MRSEGRNLDIWKDNPERMLERAIAQLEVAKIDPNFYGVVKRDRIKYYEDEVKRWKAIVESSRGILSAMKLTS